MIEIDRDRRAHSKHQERGVLLLLWGLLFGAIILVLFLGSEQIFLTNSKGSSSYFTGPNQDNLLAEAGIEHAMYEFNEAATSGYGAAGYHDPYTGDFGQYDTTNQTGRNFMTHGDTIGTGWTASAINQYGWRQLPPTGAGPDDSCDDYNGTYCYRFTFPLHTGPRFNNSPFLGWVQVTVINPYSRWPIIISKGVSSNSTTQPPPDEFGGRFGRTVRVELERTANKFQYAVFAKQGSPEKNTDASSAALCHALDINSCAFIASYNSSLASGTTGSLSSLNTFYKGAGPDQLYRQADVATNCRANAAISPATNAPGYLHGKYDSGTTCNAAFSGEKPTTVNGCLWYGHGATADAMNLPADGSGTFNITPRTSCANKQPLATVSPGNGDRHFPSVSMPLPHRCTPMPTAAGFASGTTWTITAATALTLGQTYCAASVSVTETPTINGTPVLDGTGAVTNGVKIYVRTWVYIPTSIGAPATTVRAPEKLQFYLASSGTLIDSSIDSTGVCTGYQVCIKGTSTKVQALVYAPDGKVGVLGTVASGSSTNGPFLHGAVVADWFVISQFAKLYYDSLLNTDSKYADYGTDLTSPPPPPPSAYDIPKIRAWQVIND